MKKDDKYRYNLGFGSNTEEEIRAGELLEILGNRKSTVVVAALNEYMDAHPELTQGDGALHIKVSAASSAHLEALVRRLVEEKLGAMDLSAVASSAPGQTQKVSSDIMDMLHDLDCFN